MIEDGAVERFGCSRQATRRAAVALARAWIAARVVVREHNPRAAMHGRVSNDLADWEGGAALVSGMARHVQAARIIVDMGNPERFPPRVLFRKAAGEELPRGGDAVELQREFGTLIPHASALWRNAFGRELHRVRNGANFLFVAASKMDPINPLLAIVEPV
jgi:hypothetical protein